MYYSYNKPANLDQNTLEAQVNANVTILQDCLYTQLIGTDLRIHFNTSLSAGEKTALDEVIAAHNGKSTAESLGVYLDTQVFPFVTSLVRTFAAENIAMGITQAGKTGHVLSLFSRYYPVPNASFPNNLKNSLDTGSLYISRAVLQHIRDNPSEFSGLDPFVTDARLLVMKNKIETFLGLPLSS